MPPVTILKRGGGSTGGPSGRGASGRGAPLGAPSTSAGSSKTNGLMAGNDGEPSSVAAAVAGVVEGALGRERRRLEGIYRMRQEAMMRAVSGVLHECLADMVREAVEREVRAALGRRAARRREQKEGAEIRTAFKEAFDSDLLNAIEAALRGLLEAVAGAVEKGMEERLVKPTADVAEGFKRVTGELCTLKNQLESWDVQDGAESDSVRLAKVTETISGLVQEQRIREALDLAMLEDGGVLESTMNDLVTLDTALEDVFSTSPSPPRTWLLKVIAVLAANIAHCTSSRLVWLTEAAMLLEDQDVPDESANKDELKSTIEPVVAQLTHFQGSDGLSPQDSRQCKVVIHLLRSQMLSS